MRPNRPTHVALLVLLSALLLSAIPARAAEDVTEDEYEERARVIRVSLTRGEVSLRRAGDIEWERARLNVPLVEGDTLATGPDARLEIQLDARNFIRVGADSVLRVVTLRDEGVAFSLSEGTASFRLARFDREREYFEVDAPKTTIAAEKRGLYRVDVSPRGDVNVTVRDDGRARIYSETSGFVLRENRSARLVAGASEEGDWELSAAAAPDSWDNWNGERERHLAQLLRLEQRDRYYDPEVWGAEELDIYGDWVQTSEYGYVWRPHVTVINNYYNWAPYRYGHWRYCPPYGWTWIPDEDWGWAPYHYGRWVYVNNYWCWAPRGYGYHYGRARWRPALVAFVFVTSSHGDHVAWYPLRHGQRDPRGRFWPRGYDRLSPLGRRERDNLHRANPALLRAVTSVPSREFGAASQRVRPAPTDVAQRVLTGEPVSGQLPITPGGRARTGAPAQDANNGRVLGAPSARPGSPAAGGGLVIARPAPVGPARAVPDRPTGAAVRTPGVALDDRLRGERIFGGREPRPPAPPADASSTQGEANTGAVMRPSRPTRRPSDDGGRVNNNDGRGVVDPRGGSVESSAPPRVRPARPGRPDEGGFEQPNTERVPRREREGRDESSAPRARPGRPREESPAEDRPSPPFYDPGPRVRQPEPAERPQPPSRRDDPPAPRPERPERNEPRQPERHDPPPRQEQPRYEAPPRQESPREEAPRQEAPRHEAPREERPAPAPREERPAAPERPSPRSRDQYRR